MAGVAFGSGGVWAGSGEGKAGYGPGIQAGYRSILLRKGSAESGRVWGGRTGSWGAVWQDGRVGSGVRGVRVPVLWYG